MMLEGSSKSALIEQTISLLSRAGQKVHEHDYVLAQVIIGVATQILTDIHSDLEQQLTVQRKLRMALKDAKSES